MNKGFYLHRQLRLAKNFLLVQVVISIRKNRRLYLGISSANLFADYFLWRTILIPDYSGVSETHALSSICLLHRRAVYAIDKFNYFFRVQRSICDEDNREGKSIIY